MNKVSLEEINKKGFVFRECGPPPQSILNRMIDLGYENSCLPHGEQSSYAKYLDKSDHLFKYFLDIWDSYTNLDPFISTMKDHMCVGVDKCVKNDYVMPHTDIAITGVCQAALFYPYPDENFVGRDFVYGTKEKFKKFRPKSGSICFIDTTNEDFVHAVTKLKSDHIFFAVGIYPSPPGGRNELLINRPELIDKWKVS